MAARIEPLLTVADLDACPDDSNRYELNGGELFVSRAPGIPHQRGLNNLQLAFRSYLRENQIGIVVPGAGAIFSDYDPVIPDLVFVLNERWSEVVTEIRFTGAPDLVLEIVSPGKENRDRVVKRQLYAKYGVAEYWIVDAENRLVKFTDCRNNNWQTWQHGGTANRLPRAILPGFRLGVSTIFNL